MFYEPERTPHGLPFDPFKSCVIPRPIGWISTASRDGVRNLAPYSFFNAMSWAPPTVVFGTTGRGADGSCKDTLANIEETGDFVVNIATYELAEQVNQSSTEVGHEIDEFELTGLAAAPSLVVTAPRVAASPINFECRLFQTVTLPSRSAKRPNMLVIGEVVGVHIRDELIRDGRIDVAALRPIARLGYQDWTVVERIFSQTPPARQPRRARRDAALSGQEQL